jgi:hypothetical protein
LNIECNSNNIAVLHTGQSDSTNGKNIMYDEMIEELCEADGTDRLECKLCALVPVIITLCVCTDFRCVSAASNAQIGSKLSCMLCYSNTRVSLTNLTHQLTHCMRRVQQESRVHVQPHGKRQEPRWHRLPPHNEAPHATRRDSSDLYAALLCMHAQVWLSS